MLIVKLNNGGIETPIHNEKEKLKSGNVVKGVNTIDSFSFAILPSNGGFNKIFDFQTLVSVYNTNKNRYEFQGRVLYSNTAMDSDGKISKEVTCESYFGFLCDSQQMYVAEQNWTVNGLLQHIIDVHNSQVEDYKKFTIGEVDVTDPNDNLYIGIQRENTWKTIEEKLIKKLGGEIRFRVVDGIIYLDYLTKIGTTRATPIKLSRNMKSITKEVDPSAYVTRLIPLGCKLGETEERLDISSVNGGKIYIDDEAAIAAYGIHVGYVEWDDVTTASALFNKGQNWMIESNKVQVKYSASALDLSLLGLEIDDFDVHDYHPIQNALLSIDDVARIIKKNINVCEEVSSTIEFGDNFKTLSDIQQEQTDLLKSAAQDLAVTASVLKSQVASTQNSVKELDEKVTNISEGELESIRKSIDEQSSSIATTAEGIVAEHMTKYVEKSVYDQKVTELNNKLEVTSKGIEASVETTVTELKEKDGALETRLTTMEKLLTFDENGLTIKQENSPNQVVIDNDGIEIKVNGAAVQEFNSDGESTIPDLRVRNRLKLFGFLIDPDTSGNVNCEYVGEG